MYKHILIATDGSDLAGKALAQGLALGKVLPTFRWGGITGKAGDQVVQRQTNCSKACAGKPPCVT
jgi:hypothetical protein